MGIPSSRLGEKHRISHRLLRLALHAATEITLIPHAMQHILAFQHPRFPKLRRKRCPRNERLSAHVATRAREKLPARRLESLSEKKLITFGKGSTGYAILNRPSLLVCPKPAKQASKSRPLPAVPPLKRRPRSPAESAAAKRRASVPRQLPEL